VRELDEGVEERNYAKQPLERKELQAILKVASVAEVLNTRHKTAKEHGWKEKAPSKKAFLEAALEENNLLRRPIVIHNGQAVVGSKDLDAIRTLLS
jgi:regulatory protein spx